MKRRTSVLIWVVAAYCLGLIIFNLTALDIIRTAEAQQCTCPQMNVGGNTSLTWPPGATVKVFFDDNVPEDRRAIYAQALNNWSGTQGVTFTTDVSTGMAQYTMYIKDTTAPNGNSSDRGHVVWQYWDSTGGHIEMNSNVTDTNALLDAMSHEISHNFGLNHTQDGSLSNCTSSSLYNLTIGLNDTTTGAPGPTNCDRNVINSIYQSGGVHYVAPSGGDGGGGDSGGAAVATAVATARNTGGWNIVAPRKRVGYDSEAPHIGKLSGGITPRLYLNSSVLRWVVGMLAAGSRVTAGATGWQLQ